MNPNWLLFVIPFLFLVNSLGRFFLETSPDESSSIPEVTFKRLWRLTSDQLPYGGMERKEGQTLKDSQPG